MSETYKMPIMTAEKLIEMVKRKEKPYLLDIRNDSDYLSWHLPAINHLAMSQVAGNIAKLPKKRQIITVCNRGNDSQQIAYFLQNQGFQSVSLAGGLKALNSIYDVVKVLAQPKKQLKIYQIKRLWKGCLSYIFAYGNKAIVIDATRHTQVIKGFLDQEKLKLIAVIDTHIHADHISGSLTLSQEYGVGYFLPENSVVDFGFKPLEEINKTYEGFNFNIIPTPGHTFESVCMLLNNSYLFTGDTLFPKSIGRSDLGQEVAQNARLLHESIRDKIFRLENSILVLPSHNQKPMLPKKQAIATSLGKVKKQNYISKFKTAADFVNALSNLDIPTPLNFPKIKKINQTGKIPTEDLDELEFGANRCAVKV